MRSNRGWSPPLDRLPPQEIELLASYSGSDERGRARGILPQYVRRDRPGIRRGHHAIRSPSCSTARTSWSISGYLPAQAQPQDPSPCATDKEGQLAFARYDLFLSRQLALLRPAHRYRDRDDSVLENTIVLFGSGGNDAQSSKPADYDCGGSGWSLARSAYWRNGETRMSSTHQLLPRGSASRRTRSPTARVPSATPSSAAPEARRTGPPETVQGVEVPPGSDAPLGPRPRIRLA